MILYDLILHNKHAYLAFLKQCFQGIDSHPYCDILAIFEIIMAYIYIYTPVKICSYNLLVNMNI